MKVIKLNKTNHAQVLAEALAVLKSGGSVVYPTETSYGLGCDALDLKAVRKLYHIKDREFRKQPMHVVVPSLAWAKKHARWNKLAATLAKHFLPGPLTLVLPLRSDNKILKQISAQGFLGLRYPKYNFALELAKKLGRPITATSANPSHLTSKSFDPYSANDVIKQFAKRKLKPDLIIDAGRLKKTKPSTMVRVTGQDIEIIRSGPISLASINRMMRST